MTTNFNLKAAIEKYKKEKEGQNQEEKVTQTTTTNSKSPPSIMALVNEAGANGVSLDELAKSLNVNSSDDRSRILSKLEEMKNNWLVFVKDDRYFTL